MVKVGIDDIITHLGTSVTPVLGGRIAVAGSLAQGGASYIGCSSDITKDQ
jgi:hypothetical protein